MFQCDALFFSFNEDITRSDLITTATRDSWFVPCHGNRNQAYITTMPNIFRVNVLDPSSFSFKKKVLPLIILKSLVHHDDA